jgi:type II secretion system protein G
MKMLRLKGKGGFTLVEIMIVVAIIGLLSAIAIPNFLTARQTAQANACVANLRQIEGAKVLYHLDTGEYPADLAALSTDYLRTEPKCPSGASYNVGTGSVAASCNSELEGHTL